MDVVIEKEDFYSLVELLDQFSSRWREIALFLSLTGHEIEYIFIEQGINSRCMTQVLRYFMKQARPTVGKLNNALSMAGIRDMTFQIKKSLLSYRRQIIGKLSKTAPP